jgi:hypothetical protein
MASRHTRFCTRIMIWCPRFCDLSNQHFHLDQLMANASFMCVGSFCSG